MKNPLIEKFHKDIDEYMAIRDHGERSGLQSGVMLGIVIVLGVVWLYAVVFLGLR